jgi:hypothetical protein
MTNPLSNPFIKNAVIPFVAVYLFVNFGFPLLELNPFLILVAPFTMLSYIAFMAHTSGNNK